MSVTNTNAPANGDPGEPDWDRSELGPPSPTRTVVDGDTDVELVRALEGWNLRSMRRDGGADSAYAPPVVEAEGVDPLIDRKMMEHLETTWFFRTANRDWQNPFARDQSFAVSRTPGDRNVRNILENHPHDSDLYVCRHCR
ncbi:hypothetical protein PQX77_009480, partial [Marasmius sp. AFHP31]